MSRRPKQYAIRPCACGCGEHPARWDAEYVAGHRPPKPLADRLWSRVEKLPSGCWEWQGYRGPRGYGQIGLGRRGDGITSTHRAAWIVAHGDIPACAVVRHRCDNPPCCNPAHLELGTHQDNSDDKVARRRQARSATLPHTRLTDEQVCEIRKRYIARYGPPKRGGRRSNAPELAAEFGVSKNYIFQIVNNVYRKDVA